MRIDKAAGHPANGSQRPTRFDIAYRCAFIRPTTGFCTALNTRLTRQSRQMVAVADPCVIKSGAQTNSSATISPSRTATEHPTEQIEANKKKILKPERTSEKRIKLISVHFVSNRVRYFMRDTSSERRLHLSPSEARKGFTEIKTNCTFTISYRDTGDERMDGRSVLFFPSCAVRFLAWLPW